MNTWASWWVPVTVSEQKKEQPDKSNEEYISSTAGSVRSTVSTFLSVLYALSTLDALHLISGGSLSL